MLVGQMFTGYKKLFLLGRHYSYLLSHNPTFERYHRQQRVDIAGHLKNIDVKFNYSVDKNNDGKG